MKYALYLLAVIQLIFGCTSVYNTKYVKAGDHIRDINIENAYRSTALLMIYSPDGKSITATGFAYNKDLIITAGHFCIGALEIQIFDSHKQHIIMSNYDSELRERLIQKNIRIRDISKIEDLCILEKKDHGLFPLPIIKDYEELKVRDDVTVIGHPSGGPLGEFGGKIMSLSYKTTNLKVRGKLVVSSASTGGVSGSAVILDRTGEVIGVLVRSNKGFDHLSFGVTGKDLKVFVDGIK